MTDRTSPSPGPQEPLDWQFLQCFGERTPGEEVQEADVISAVEFDHDGQHLATGDRGGRVVLFERVAAQPRPVGPDSRSPPPNRLSSFEYRYLTEFQSHEPEFDYLKSLEIEEKINKVRWCRASNGSRMVLSTNDKTVKLWKVFEKRVERLSNFNLPADAEGTGGRDSWTIPTGVSGTNGVSSMGGSWTHRSQLRLPKVSTSESTLASRCRRVWANAHTYHINSISISSDQETFISSDDLRINLWHLDVTDQAFNIVDIKPDSMEDLTEVITSAEFHPHQCSIFVYSSSKGCIRLADMREAALCDRHAKAYEEVEAAGTRSFFSEIISSISDVKFSRDGRYLLSRDYMTLKLWDLAMEARPLAVFPTHEHLRARLCDVYENDCIFDKFDCCMSGKGDHIATGSYSNFFKVVGRSSGAEVLLEASRDPLRKRLQTPKSASRFGLSRNSASKRANNGSGALGDADAAALDFSAKLLHLAWHPSANVIAAAASNSLYMYCAR